MGMARAVSAAAPAKVTSPESRAPKGEETAHYIQELLLCILSYPRGQILAQTAPAACKLPNNCPMAPPLWESSWWKSRKNKSPCAFLSPCPSKSAEDRLVHFSENWTFQDGVYPVNEIFCSHPKGDLQTLLSHRQLGSMLTQWQPEPKRGTWRAGDTAAVPETDPWLHDRLTGYEDKVKSVSYEKVQVVQQGWDENWKAFQERLIEAFKKYSRGFPGGSLGKNPCASAGHMGSIPDPGRSHVSWSS